MQFRLVSFSEIPINKASKSTFRADSNPINTSTYWRIIHEKASQFITQLQEKEVLNCNPIARSTAYINVSRSSPMLLLKPYMLVSRVSFTMIKARVLVKNVDLYRIRIIHVSHAQSLGTPY